MFVICSLYRRKNRLKLILLSPTCKVIEMSNYLVFLVMCVIFFVDQFIEPLTYFIFAKLHTSNGICITYVWWPVRILFLKFFESSFYASRVFNLLVLDKLKRTTVLANSTSLRASDRSSSSGKVTEYSLRRISWSLLSCSWVTDISNRNVFVH